MTSFADTQSPSAETKQKQCPMAAAAQHKTVDAPTGTADRQIYIDPQTGAIVPPPADAPPTAESGSTDESLNTSSEGLVQTPSPVPGGGIKLDVQGRFRSPLVATQEADGKVTIQHREPTPHTGEK